MTLVLLHFQDYHIGRLIESNFFGQIGCYNHVNKSLLLAFLRLFADYFLFLLFLLDLVDWLWLLSLHLLEDGVELQVVACLTLSLLRLFLLELSILVPFVEGPCEFGLDLGGNSIER